MKKNTIVQFVCFVTDLGLEEFTPKWERYAQRLATHNAETTLQEQAGAKSKYRYISQHEWLEGDFHFTFMNQKKSEHFPEHNVKVIQAGGYSLLQTEQRIDKINGDLIKLIVFTHPDENDINFFVQLSGYSRLNIFQPFFESCAFGYVMEFFITEDHADKLLQQLKLIKGIDAGMYKECLMFQE